MHIPSGRTLKNQKRIAVLRIDVVLSIFVASVPAAT